MLTFQARSRPVPDPFQARSNFVPAPFQRRSPSLEEVRAEYISAMVEGADHANPGEQFDFDIEQMTAAELARVGRSYLAMAEWKLSYGPETSGVTRGTPVVARDSAD